MAWTTVISALETPDLRSVLADWSCVYALNRFSLALVPSGWLVGEHSDLAGWIWLKVSVSLSVKVSSGQSILGEQVVPL